MKSKKNKKLNRSWSFVLSILVVCLDLFFQNYFRQKGIGVNNLGMSFGLFSGFSHFWIIGLLVILGLIFFSSDEAGSVYLRSMIIGGVGNLSSRLIFGDVWDYISIPVIGLWINLSDVLISLAAISFILGRNDDRNTLRRW